LNSNSYSSWY